MWTKHENQWGVFYHFLTQDLAYLIGVVNANPWQPACQHNPGSLWLNLIPWVGNASGMPVLLQALQFVRLFADDKVIIICANNVIGICRELHKGFGIVFLIWLFSRRYLLCFVHVIIVGIFRLWVELMQRDVCAVLGPKTLFVHHGWLTVRLKRWKHNRWQHQFNNNKQTRTKMSKLKSPSFRSANLGLPVLHAMSR